MFSGMDFFYLQHCVSEDYSSVDIWMGDALFRENGLPKTVEDYFGFLVKEHIFLDKRRFRSTALSIIFNAKMIGTIWRAIRHMGHNDIGVTNPSGNGGRSSGDGQDGGSRVAPERAGEDIRRRKG